ncbi:MAG: hypothetical protein AAFR20_01245 [Pseudomonadota bacterium]
MYAYVGNDPINAVDPTGLEIAKDSEKAGRKLAKNAARNLRRLAKNVKKKERDGFNKRDKRTLKRFEDNLGEFNDENLENALVVLDQAANLGLGDSDLTLSGGACSGGLARIPQDSVVGNTGSTDGSFTRITKKIWFSDEFFESSRTSEAVTARHELFHLSGANLIDGVRYRNRQTEHRALVGSSLAFRNAKNYECYALTRCGTVTIVGGPERIN